MNINTTKLIPTFDKCSGTAWKRKFINSWYECDVWCDYIKYYYYASYIAQVYIINSPFIPKGSVLKFPFPVKTYNPELFSGYKFNNVLRKSDGIKDFIISDEFTTAYDITSKELDFYLTSDIKIPQSYVLNKFRSFLLNLDAKVPVNGEITIGRLIQLQPLDINTFIDTEITIDVSQSLLLLSNVSISANVVALSQCYCWGDWDAWGDYDNWEEV